MKKKQKFIIPIWSICLAVTLLFLWIGIKSSVIYKSSEFEPVSIHIYEKDISHDVSFNNFEGNYILNLNYKTYTISKDRDTTIVLKETSENQNGISKKTREFLMYNKSSNRFTQKCEITRKNTKEARNVSILSILHFILVGIPAYVISIIFLLITILTFLVWKDELKENLKT